MKTAIEWLVEHFFSTTGELQVEEIIKKAKEMEQKQILDAWKEGYDLAINGERLPKL